MRFRALAPLMTVVALTGVLGTAPSASAGAAGSAEEFCGVKAHDKRLWCGNGADAPTRYAPYHESSFSGLLMTSYSWFDCFAFGGWHGGNNATWYHTTPDWGDPGYIPADWVNTPPSFDANPQAYGLRPC